MNIKELSVETGIPESRLELLYKIIFDNLKKANPTKSDEEISRFAFEETKARSIKAQLQQSKVEDFEGKVLTSTSINNQYEIRKNQVAKLNKEEAITKRLINEQGQILDNFGNPMKEDTITRTLTGVCLKLSDGSGPKPFILWLNGEAAKAFDPRTMLDVPLIFSAVDRSKDNNKFLLHSSSPACFKISNTKLPGVRELLETYLKDSFIKLNQLSDWHSKYGNVKEAIVAVEANIMELDATVNENGNKRMYIDDLEDLNNSSMTFCWVSGELKEYPLYSRVFVLGKTFVNQRDGSIGLNVLGMHPINVININAQLLDGSSLEEPKFDGEERFDNGEKLGGEEFV